MVAQTQNPVTLGKVMRHSILFLLILTARVFAVQSVALYDAGVAGNPTAAPSPSSAGWTAGVPTSDVANFSSAAVSPDGATGFNAWRMLDNSTAASQFITWTKSMTTQQHADAAAYGWKLSTRIRVADPVASNGGANSTVLLSSPFPPMPTKEYATLLPTTPSSHPIYCVCFPKTPSHWYPPKPNDA